MNFNFDKIITYFLQVFSGCRQITFITLNGFCLSNNPPSPLFLTDNIKMDRILTNIFHNVFQVLKVVLIKICKIQSQDLFFLFHVVFISFYISRYHFSQVFRTSFNIILKYFRFTQLSTHPTPHPLHPHLNSQNLLSVIKVFCQFSQIYHSFSRLLCYDVARKSRAELILQSNFNPRIVVVEGILELILLP